MNLKTIGQTLDCGQSFRWNLQPDGSWDGVAGNKRLHITPDNFTYVLKDAFWAHYFDMELDYDGIREDFCRMDPVLADTARYAPDMRILNQDPWEALCSFILSQCNNIKRIKGIVQRLCTRFGEPMDEGFCAFPSPEVIAALEEENLREIGCGFRAPYVLDAARQVASGKINLEEIRQMPLDEAHSHLMKISGVGVKVADCALLYGLHRLDAFPMDVWMKRAMKTLFPGREPTWFGPYAGIAQQYVFHYSRNHPELFPKPNH